MALVAEQGNDVDVLMLEDVGNSRDVELHDIDGVVRCAGDGILSAAQEMAGGHDDVRRDGISYILSPGRKRKVAEAGDNAIVSLAEPRVIADVALPDDRGSREVDSGVLAAGGEKEKQKEGELLQDFFSFTRYSSTARRMISDTVRPVFWASALSLFTWSFVTVMLIRSISKVYTL